METAIMPMIIASSRMSPRIVVCVASKLMCALVCIFYKIALSKPIDNPIVIRHAKFDQSIEFVCPNTHIVAFLSIYRK